MPFVILDVLQTQCKCSAGHLQKEYFVPKVWELEESSDHNNYGEDDVCVCVVTRNETISGYRNYMTL